MMQELLLLLLLFICDSVILPNVLWQGLKPANSLSGARDYARSAVTSWTLLRAVKIKHIQVPYSIIISTL